MVLVSWAHYARATNVRVADVVAVVVVVAAAGCAVDALAENAWVSEAADPEAAAAVGAAGPAAAFYESHASNLLPSSWWCDLKFISSLTVKAPPLYY
jgi:hypothetical protein